MISKKLITELEALIVKEDNVDLLQFTGLLDKNGKEIYEGDIIDWGDNFNSIVYWADNTAAWQIRELGIVKRKGERTPRTHDMSAYTGKPIILGNAYENPELLK